MTTWRDKRLQYPVGSLDNGDETTEKSLLDTLYSTRTISKPLPGYSSSDLTRYTLGVDCDEVYPRIYLGDMGAARNKAYLKRIGITHVLNTAEGNRFGMVNTNQFFYKDTKIKYLGIQLLDLPTTNIAMHFHEAADFIEGAVKSGGKVLVHCLMGVSRSATCVLAYLMLKEQYTALEAVRTVRQNRAISPNNGFLHQLAGLDNKLRRDRNRRSDLDKDFLLSRVRPLSCQHL